MKVPKAKLLAPKSMNFSQLYAKEEQKDKMKNILCHSDFKDFIKLTTTTKKSNWIRSRNSKMGLPYSCMFVKYTKDPKSGRLFI